VAEDNDPLSRTETAPAAASSSATPPAELSGTTIGRYRIERELGAGGMGVVYVAFDPDLERRIALKVLRAANHDAAKRLQREAKAMARLTHPNVVTVYEVATATGRDYVAMELVEGESLADWLRAERREPAAILDAFVAAGRGLAAAHAAGIVHRDFKPHNVLRGKSGRIAVTDFGLAREASLDPASDPLAVTLPVGADPTITPATTPSSLSGLTVTGAVLGTPAYMAPEQWRGAAVSPATDQFAFCVALWEALAGERPFRGKTVEELKAQVEEGPAKLDPSRLPRRVRELLLRGLDPDPARRWPSIDALLARLAPPRSRTGLLTALGGGVVAVGAAAVVALGLGAPATPPEPPCPAPVLDPDVVWSPDAAQAVAAGKQAETGRFIDKDMRAWREARMRVCEGASTERVAKLACLDGVLSRIKTVAKVLPALAAQPYVDGTKQLIDPAVCLVPVPPRLVMSSALTDEVIAASLIDPEPVDPKVREALAARVEPDPCAKGLLLLANASQRNTDDRGAALAAAQQASEACGDDRLRADVALFDVTNTMLVAAARDTSPAKVQRAEAVIARVAQPDLVAILDELKAFAAERIDDLDRAIERMEAAASGMAARGRFAGELAARLRILDIRGRRGRPEDVAAIEKMLAEWGPRARERLGDDSNEVRMFEGAAAYIDLYAGRLEEAAARLARTRRTLPQQKSIQIRGKLVDQRGAPVAGARVVTASQLFGTSLTAAMSMTNDGSWRETTTGADGTFTFADAPTDGVVVAELGAQRSLGARVTDGLTLTLAPTSRIAGRVTSSKPLPANLHVNVWVVGTEDSRYTLVAPLRADGSFELAGVPRDQLALHATQLRQTAGSAHLALDVREPEVKNVVLALPADGRKLYVVVRSSVATPVGNAQVVVLHGERRLSNVRELAQAQGSGMRALARAWEDVRPEALADIARKGDLFAELAVPASGGTACAIGLPTELGDLGVIEKLQQHSDKIEVRCVPIPSDKTSIVIEVPPLPRLD
jgi:predicted Ser/Thr protein kinase